MPGWPPPGNEPGRRPTSACSRCSSTPPSVPSSTGFWNRTPAARHGRAANPRLPPPRDHNLYAALNVASGKVIADLTSRHRAEEFRRFLNLIDKAVPAHLDVHVVVDNSSTHKAPTIQRRLLRHPRFTLHFTPTYSSWLNLVERWFAELTHQVAAARHPPLGEGADCGTALKQRDVQLQAGGVEARPSTGRHHLNALKDQAHEFTPLAEVGLRPELPRLRVQDYPLLARSVNDRVEPLDLPLQPCPDRAVAAYGEHPSDVVVLVERLQPALRRSELGERSTERPGVTWAGLGHQHLPNRRGREQLEHPAAMRSSTGWARMASWCPRRRPAQT